ncbi:MAG: DUF402 domain-containing protein [Halobacteriales archaeon]|nr:DUF402 domain-containing protein [Halobacteriales archaeon]
MNVKVRGVYTTAVTRLLLDSEHDVVEPSDAIRGRFDAEFGDGTPDVEVRNSDDYLGLYVVGVGARRVAETLAVAPDSFVFDAVPVGVARDATVEETTGSGAFVRFDDGRGFLPYSKVDDRIEEGDELRVTVIEEAAPWSNGSPVVAGGERVGNELVTFVRGGSGARVEGGSADDATQLTRTTATLGVEPPSEWGVVYSRAALDADMDELADAMRDAKERVEDGGNESEAAWVWLGREGRSVYDEARAEQTTTVPGHHRLKATSKTASAGVDIAEAVVEDADPTDDMPFGVMTRRFGPQEGDQIEISHGKPDGRFPSLGRGEVVEVDAEDREVVVERRITSSGTYDALGVEREDGDIARTRFEEGARAYATVYESAEGEKKGTYVNICTPLEIFPDAVRYVDLHVDVVNVDDETRTVDEEELADAVEEELVPEETAAEARDVAERVEEGL